MRLELPPKFVPFLDPYRYKFAHGGRGSAKSWSVANILVNVAARTPKRIVCAREFQNSIDESVHKLLSNRIKYYNLPFQIDKTRIYNSIGSEFIFKGLYKGDASTIKSLEDADICWVEEAQKVSKASWDNLIPTIRKEGSEIWGTLNPDLEDDPTYQRFILNPPPDSYVVQVNYNDNPWFPDVLERERLHMSDIDPVSYMNVWEGRPRSFAEGAFFRAEIEALEANGRIGDVPYDSNKPVYVWFDLGHAASGKGDPHAIWFVQDGGGTTFNIIDYWEGNNKSLPDVAKIMLGKPYTYAKVVLPHDGARVNSHTGKSDAEILEDFGFKVELQERTKSLDRDTNNVRLVLPMCRFDKEKCSQGIKALKHHRQEKDEKTGLWKFIHDWTSHGTSAFRYFSVGYDIIRPQIEHDDYRGVNILTM